MAQTTTQKLGDVPRIPSLDGLRALAILLVLIGHSEILLNLSQTPTLFTRVFFNHGLGVSFFFVISGFLITWLLKKERERQGSLDLGAFYLRRAFRILPVFYLYLFTILCLRKIELISFDSSEWVSSFLFIWNYIPGQSDWWLAHSWSLCVEEQFYLLWPACLYFLGEKRASRVCVGLILASPLLRGLSYSLLPGLRDHLPNMLHTRADSLMFGCLMALYFDEEGFKRFTDKLFSAGAQYVSLVYVFIGCPLLDEWFESKHRLVFGYTLESACIMLIILWLVKNPFSRVGRVFNSKPMIRIGLLSYSLYLWQQLSIGLAAQYSGHSFLVVYGGLFLIAEVSYRFCERPFLRLRGKLNAPFGDRSVVV